MKQLRNNAILCNGKYKIERVLGQGGFGITYLAKQKVSVAGALGTIDAEIEVTIKEFFMKELCNRDGFQLNFLAMKDNLPKCRVPATVHYSYE